MTLEPATNPASIPALMAELTLAEKCRLVVGKGSWIVNGCARLGLPEWTTSDGPVGVRGRRSGPGLVVPGPSALAATWNLDLVGEIGAAIGTECLDRRVDLLLGPTTNLHRSPRGGRHFECFSEDPLLSTRLAVAYVRGVQAQGVGACIKHFILNDQETDRFTIDVQVDERTLREVYLPPFEAAVKEAGVRAVMASYNYVNGDHACAHRGLLVDLLKNEWSFDGLVVSDWFALKDLQGPANNGLDLEMPGPGDHWGSEQLLAAAQRGDVAESAIDDKVRRILGFMQWRGRLQGESDHEEESVERPEHRALARRAAAEGMVLVRNDGGLLPLGDHDSVALIGPAFCDLTIQGGGSAQLSAHRAPSLLATLASRLGSRLAGHVRGPDLARLPTPVRDEWLAGDAPVVIEAFDSVGFDGPLVDTIRTRHPAKIWLRDPVVEGRTAFSVRETVRFVPPAPGRYAILGLGVGQVAVYLDGDLVADSFDGGLTVSFAFSVASTVVELPEERLYEIRVEAVSNKPPRFAGIDVRIAAALDDFEAACQAAEALARIADTAVVAVGSTAEWETESQDRDTLELPARQSELVERVIVANPDTVVVLNCGAPIDMPWFDDAKCILQAWYPGQEGADAIADVLLGDAEPAGRMPTTWARRESDTPSFDHYPGSNGVVRYEEGLFVGYRHYDRAGIEPAIAFGHGLSFSTFDWGTPTVRGSGTDWTVEVPVANTGTRPGAAVVQAYVGPAAAEADRPTKQLAGFAKLTLEPGSAGVAEIHIDERAFSMWDVDSHGWQTRPGSYTLSVAASATDIRSLHTIEVR